MDCADFLTTTQVVQSKGLKILGLVPWMSYSNRIDATIVLMKLKGNGMQQVNKPKPFLRCLAHLSGLLRMYTISYIVIYYMCYMLILPIYLPTLTAVVRYY